MYGAGLLSQKTGMVRAHFSPEPSVGNTSDANDFYFYGTLFGGKSPAFGTNLTLEEIADRYGLSE